MSWLAALIPAPLRLWALGLAAAALLGLVAWQVRVQREVGRDQVRAEWAAANAAQLAVDLEAARANAKETQRRMDRQQENQRAQDLELAAARADAGRNRADADRLRDQNASIAKQWRDALGNTPTVQQCEAAGDAIGVLADVLGRADRRAGVLASYADAARAAGLKCERDYDALTPSVQAH